MAKWRSSIYQSCKDINSHSFHDTTSHTDLDWAVNEQWEDSSGKKSQSCTFKHYKSVCVWERETEREFDSYWNSKTDPHQEKIFYQLICCLSLCLSVQLSHTLWSWAYRDFFMMTYPLSPEGHLTFLPLNSHSQTHTHTHIPHTPSTPHPPISLSSLSLQTMKCTHLPHLPVFSSGLVSHSGSTLDCSWAFLDSGSLLGNVLIINHLLMLCYCAYIFIYVCVHLDFK